MIDIHSIVAVFVLLLCAVCCQRKSVSSALAMRSPANTERELPNAAGPFEASESSLSSIFYADMIGHIPGLDACYFRDAPRTIRIGDHLHSKEWSRYRAITTDQNNEWTAFVAFLDRKSSPSDLRILESPLLRGIAIGTLTDDIAAKLGSINLDKVCISLYGNDTIDNAGKLPTHTKYLAAHPNITPYSIHGQLSHLEQLQFLEVKGVAEDAAFLSDLKALRSLRLVVSNADVVPNVTELRDLLYFSGSLPPSILAQLTGLGDLNLLTLTKYPMNELAPLRRLERLEVKYVTEEIPPQLWPRLQFAYLVGTTASSPRHEDFVAGHPSTAIISTPRKMLVHRLQQAVEMHLRFENPESRKYELIKLKNQRLLRRLERIVEMTPESTTMIVSACAEEIATAKIIDQDAARRDTFEILDGGEYRDLSFDFDDLNDFRVIDTKTICLKGSMEGCVKLDEKSASTFQAWLKEVGVSAHTADNCAH